jgi:hypothetical protein
MVQPRRRFRAASGVVLAIAILTPVFAAAVGPAGPAADRIETELRRTDALIDRARDEVADARGGFAHERLRQATEVQRDAWIEFGRLAPDLRRVVKLTQQARRMALKAIEAAGIEHRALESVRILIDRAEARAEEVAATVRDSGGTLAVRLLEQAQQQLRRARQAWAANDPRAARLATLSLSLIERAERVAVGSGAATAAVQASIDRAEALLAEVDARLADAASDGDLTALRAEAGGLMARAREALRRGGERQALHLSLQARGIGLRLLGRLQRQPSEADLLPALEDLEALRSEIAPQIEASGSAEARGRLAQSGEQLEKARRLVTTGRTQEAVTALAAAEALLREAADAADVR